LRCRAIARFVEYYDYERLHEAIGNVTPDDMYHGRHHAIVSRRKETKRLTLERRKKENLRNAAWPQTGARTLSGQNAPIVSEET
jgi:putative transposase